MTSIVAPVEDDFKVRIEKFPWINWSGIAREEMNKRRIFEEYKKTRKLSKEDETFCEELDWHPVDELPLKEEFIKKLNEAESGHHKKMSMEELKQLLGLK
jgi:hypothetical protein